jgi:hypothetical protein
VDSFTMRWVRGTAMHRLTLFAACNAIAVSAFEDGYLGKRLQLDSVGSQAIPHRVGDLHRTR